ncbi:MAG: hypothetical protein MJZ19_10150 [Paludibacteraceae bacterium]|nr:hypothetical protein [Paludibacteraceae bacterium]
MALSVLLIFPLLPILGYALLAGAAGGAASLVVNFVLFRLMGWDEEKVKNQIKNKCPKADKFKIESKNFHSGSYHVDAGVFCGTNKCGTLPIETQQCPDSVYVGRVYYIDK